MYTKVSEFHIIKIISARSPRRTPLLSSLLIFMYGYTMRLDSWLIKRKKSEFTLEMPEGYGEKMKREEGGTHKDVFDNLYLLVSADYDPNIKSVFLKLYDVNSHEIKILYDKTGHKPYAYSKEKIEKLRKDQYIIKNANRILEFITEIKHDPITDRDVQVTKIIADDPLVIGGTSSSLRNFIKLWEADIKYYTNYLFDTGLNIGKYYKLENGHLKEQYISIEPKIQDYLDKFSDDEQMSYWIKLLSEPVPNYRLLAVDIEVYVSNQSRMPQPDNPEDPIFIFSFMGTDGLKKVLLYNIRNEAISEVEDFDIEIFDNEGDMIKRAVEIMMNYPIIVTFNGDNFDMRYIKKRAEHINLEDIVKEIRLGRNDARVNWGIHIDLYNFFKNVSIKNYAFGGKYDEISLDSIGKSILGLSKLTIKEGFDKYSLTEICRYSFRDVEITYRLAVFNNQLVMKLITIISRIANMTIDDVCRLSVSNWIKNRLIDLHRKRNYLIPRREEIESKGGGRHFEPVTKGKKYKGAIVESPRAGIHFNIYVLDIASLYPSIMKEYNISYETVNCPHPECKSNIIPETTTWICKLRRGVVSEFVGNIRDVRVNIFKKLSRDENISPETRELYNVIQNVLKVFINASYGVFGAEEFFLFYLPAAEAIATLGRHAINYSIKEAKHLNLDVIYGDTDSLFIKNPDPKKLELLINNVGKKLKLQLEIDKIYKYVVFSQRKKNYFGVLMDGTLDVKGLVGKKSSTPDFIKEVFYDILEHLKNISNEEEFIKAKEEIIRIITEAEEKIRHRKVDIEDLAIGVTLSKPLAAYTKTTPQHVKAARMLEQKLKRNIVPGSVIRYVKTTNQTGVKPIELVKSPDEIDIDKYIELLWSTITQITDALDISQTKAEVTRRLDQFFA